MLYNEHGEPLPRGLTITLDELAAHKRAFDEEISSKEAAIDWIVANCLLEPLVCDSCRSTETYREKGASQVRCKVCRQVTFLFADTFFHRIHKPIAYAALFWLHDRGVGISANRLADFSGVVQSTAELIRKKLNVVIAENMLDEGTILSSEMFKPLCSKRSSQTPAKLHPSSEQDEIDKEYQDRRQKADQRDPNTKTGNPPDESYDYPPDDTNDYPPNNTDVSPPGKTNDHSQEFTDWAEDLRAVYTALSTPMSAAQLCDSLDLPVNNILSAVTMLRLDGKICHSKTGMLTQSPSISGKRDYSVELTQAVKDLLSKFFEHIKHVHHGVSRKNLQWFLCAFWAFVDRTHWSTKSLMQACLRFRHISTLEIRHYVSPPFVKMLPA